MGFPKQIVFALDLGKYNMNKVGFVQYRAI